MDPKFRPGGLIFFSIVMLVVVIVKKASADGEKSLFDEVPLNGAFVPPDIDYSSLPTETFTMKLPPDPTRPLIRQDRKKKASLFDEIPNQGAFPHETQSSKTRTTRDSVDFDVTRIAPSNEFDISYWDKRFLAPIVNSIASRPSPQEDAPTRFPALNFNSHRGPPFPQSPRNHYGPPPPPRRHNNQYHNHHQQQHFHRGNGWQLSTPAYKEEYQNGHQNKTLHVSANSGGPTVIVYTNAKKDGLNAKQEIPETTEAPTKNEIHYHYHMQNEDSRPKPPPYGRPLFPPRRRPPPPPPLSSSYGVPPPSKAHYPPSVRPQSNTYRNTESSANLGNFNHDDQPQDHDDDFSRRTFITKSRTHPSSYNPVADSYSKPPSTSYEIPPSFNAPSSSYASPPPSTQYGPPSHHKEPVPSYGPSTSPPAPPPPQQSDSGADQYETTITLQTIPITRQVTELVQVPNVVHKISSNRPVQSEHAVADDQTQLSTSYGAPAPPPSRISITTPSPRMNIRDNNNERPFETHLSQILGANPTQASRDTLIQDLLLSQARNPGYDLTLNDLELLSLLQASKGGGSGGASFSGGLGSSVGILQPQSIRQSNLLGNLLGGRNQFPVSSFGGGQGSNLGWGSNNDGLASLREAFREQRLQIALQDLRKQVREQGRDSQRERTGYRSLFTKGAMLLSALTFLPSMMNPMAAAAGLGSASSVATIPNFMLPVTAASGMGRRKRRSLEENHTFEHCLDNPMFQQKHNYSTDFKNYRRWLDCSSILELDKGNLSKSLKSLINQFSGTRLRSSDLDKLLTCTQRDFCNNVLQTTEKTALLRDYSIIFQDMDKNPWVQDSIRAAKTNQCDIFSCP